MGALSNFFYFSAGVIVTVIAMNFFGSSTHMQLMKLDKNNVIINDDNNNDNNDNATVITNDSNIITNNNNNNNNNNNKVNVIVSEEEIKEKKLLFEQLEIPQNPVCVVIAIHSSVNSEQREMIRKSWLQYSRSLSCVYYRFIVKNEGKKSSSHLSKADKEAGDVFFGSESAKTLTALWLEYIQFVDKDDKIRNYDFLITIDASIFLCLPILEADLRLQKKEKNIISRLNCNDARADETCVDESYLIISSDIILVLLAMNSNIRLDTQCRLGESLAIWVQGSQLISFNHDPRLLIPPTPSELLGRLEHVSSNIKDRQDSKIYLTEINKEILRLVADGTTTTTTTKTADNEGISSIDKAGEANNNENNVENEDNNMCVAFIGIYTGNKYAEMLPSLYEEAKEIDFEAARATLIGFTFAYWSEYCRWPVGGTVYHCHKDLL